MRKDLGFVFWLLCEEWLSLQRRWLSPGTVWLMMLALLLRALVLGAREFTGLSPSNGMRWVLRALAG